jgi:hypothetical protein
MAVGSDSRTIVLDEGGTWKEVRSLALGRKPATLAFHQDGTRLAIGSGPGPEGRAVRVRDLPRPPTGLAGWGARLPICQWASWPRGPVTPPGPPVTQPKPNQGITPGLRSNGVTGPRGQGLRGAPRPPTYLAGWVGSPLRAEKEHVPPNPQLFGSFIDPPAGPAEAIPSTGGRRRSPAAWAITASGGQSEGGELLLVRHAFVRSQDRPSDGAPVRPA